MSNNIKLSNLRLEDIKIIENHFIINPDVPFKEWDGPTPINVSPSFQVHDQDESIGRVIIEVKLFDKDFDENKYPFFLKTVILGQFKMSDHEEGNIIDQYGINMTSMLLPYARSYIAALTGLAGIDAIHIPAINVMRLFEELEDEEETNELD